MPDKFFNVTENPAQQQFLLSTARFPAFIGGIGSGKTAVGSVKALYKLPDGDGIMVASDLPHFYKSTWQEFKKWCPWDRCTNKHLEHPYTNRKVLKFDIGGEERKIFYGGIDDEDAWTGLNVNWCFFDEARRKRTRKAFDTLAGRIRIGPNPQLWVTSSPNGVSHWMYEVFVEKKLAPNVMKALRDAGYEGALIEHITARTEFNRHNLDPVFYASQMALYEGKLAEQELGGEFITMEGAVWENFTLARNVSVEADYRHGVPVEWWVDDGFTKKHPRVFLLAQVIPPYAYVFDEYFAYRELAEVSIENALKKEWAKPEVAYVDSSAAQLRRRLWDEDIDTVGATHDVEEGIKRAASWILDGDGVAHLKFHPRCVRSVREIPSYVREEKNLKPAKVDDHAADCVRYGLWHKNLIEIIEEGEGAPHPSVRERLKALRDVRTNSEQVRQGRPLQDPRAWYAQQYQRMADSTRSRIQARQHPQPRVSLRMRR